MNRPLVMHLDMWVLPYSKPFPLSRMKSVLGLPRFGGSCEELVKEERHPCGMGGLFHPVMEVLHAHSALGAKS
jgi:hypothetical protein